MPPPTHHQEEQLLAPLQQLMDTVNALNLDAALPLLSRLERRVLASERLSATTAATTLSAAANAYAAPAVGTTTTATANGAGAGAVAAAAAATTADAHAHAVVGQRQAKDGTAAADEALPAEQHLALRFLWNATSVPVSIPIFLEEDQVVEASLSELVTCFGAQTSQIFTAVFCEKRIVFVGYQLPASAVCTMVLSSCLLVSPPLLGTMRRAFPYANLADMSFLEVPGFIAGVTNPLFESRSEWWDLLCNVATGDIRLNPAYEQELSQAGPLPPTNATSSRGSGGGGGHGAAGGQSAGRAGSNAPVPGSLQYMHNQLHVRDMDLSTTPAQQYAHMQEFDAAFMQDVVRGVKRKASEEWVRCMFRDYAEHLVLMAQDREVFRNARARALEQDANQSRVSLFLRSQQYKRYECDVHQRDAQESPFGPALHNTLATHSRTLRIREDDSSRTAFVLADIVSSLEGGDGHGDAGSMKKRHLGGKRDRILTLLTLFPESQGGLFALGTCVLHSNSDVREAAVRVLREVDAVPEGKRRIACLNYFLLLAFHRQVRTPAKLGNMMSQTKQQSRHVGLRGRADDQGGRPFRQHSKYADEMFHL